MRSPATSKRAKLEAKIAPLRKQLMRLHDEEQREEARKLVGRYFKYRNCYSCPQEESDYWWLYVKVTGMSDFHAKAIKFQIDKYGKMEVEPDRFFSNTGGYVEITAKEYEAAWQLFKKNFSRFK